MNLRISNQLNMVSACLAIAQSPDNKPVWQGNPPLAFGSGLTHLQERYGVVTTKAALTIGATAGAADAKALAETVLEDQAYVLARALASHFKGTGRTENRAKVDVTKSEIVRLRDQDLIARATEIRDLAQATVPDIGADTRGVTADRVTTLTAAIDAFQSVLSLPRGKIATRGTILKEIETDVADLLARLNDLDDLIVQFDETDEEKRFVSAWKRARMVLDLGGGPGGDATPPPATASVSRADGPRA